MSWAFNAHAHTLDVCDLRSRIEHQCFWQKILPSFFFFFLLLKICLIWWVSPPSSIINNIIKMMNTDESEIYMLITSSLSVSRILPRELPSLNYTYIICVLSLNIWHCLSYRSFRASEVKSIAKSHVFWGRPGIDVHSWRLAEPLRI